jgi:thioredoxin reductase (NADPH)
MKTKFDYECAVIGAGPGGLVSSIYLSRFKRKVIVIDAGDPRAQWIPRIRNLVAHPDGLTGKQLLKRLRDQSEQYRTQFLHGKARVRRLPAGGFKITVAGVHKNLKTIFTAENVILATGMKDVEPEVPNLEELKLKAVLAYCPICDSFEHAKDEIGLLIKDGKGLKKAKFLARFCKTLHVFQVKKFKVSSRQLSNIKKLNVKFYQGELESLELAKNPKGLWIKQKGKRPFYVKMAYVALGTKIDHSAVTHIYGLKKTKEGFYHTTAHQETTVPGLYAVGDCVNGLSQVSVAVGHAAVAATRVHNSLGL